MMLRKNPPWNVLVFPAASEVGLEIHRALAPCKEVILHGANQPGHSIAGFHFLRLHSLPSIHDPDCLSRLQHLIVTQEIDAIFPAYDDVVVWLAENAGHLATKVLAPALPVCALLRSKSATYAAIQNSLPVPRLWNPESDDIPFPVFVKPDKGQGSQRARRIGTRSELKQALASEPDLIVMDDLPGEEYTVDCFSSPAQGLLFAKARRRIHTKAGIATLTQTVDLPLAEEWARIIMRNIPLRGAWFFQMKADREGELRLLEIAPRIAGSMALSRMTGPNFPLLTLYEAADHPVTIPTEPASPPMTMGRSLDTRFAHYFTVDALYVDLDDTLILRGEVNTRLVALVFQNHNRGVPVYLITRHKGDLESTLTKFRLTQLFDRVIHITDDMLPKANFITETNAVLIDDSFAERNHAAKTGHIRCFDAAGALCLIDDRR